MPRGEAACDVADGGAFWCVVPAAPLDLRLRAPKTIAHYAAFSGDARDLGEVVLRPGASLLGRVRLHDSVRDAKRLRVAATASGDVSPRPATVEAAVSRRGTFHFDGLAPGEYVVRAVADEGVSSPPVTVRVVDLAEAELREVLVVARPARLVVSVAPPRAPDGRPWRITLDRGNGFGREDTVTESSASPEGSWTSPPLHPGPYDVSVGTQDGDRLALESVALSGEAKELAIAVRVTRARGRVRLGGQPLEARIELTGSGVQTSALSDAEGWFELLVPLPLSPDLAVVVESESPVVHRLARMTLRSGADGELAADVDLPLTIVAGTVVDGDGRPSPRALVNLDRVGAHVAGEPISSTTTAADGTFAFHGLAPARYSLQAESTDALSDRAEVALAEDGTAEQVRLVLAPLRMLRGEVVSRFGPVAGAAVAITADGLQNTPLVRSDPAGRFKVPVPSSARAAEVNVSAPGFGARLYRTSIAVEALTIVVAPEAGALEVLVAGDAPVALLRNGIARGLAMMSDWTGGRVERDGVATRFVLPALEPGSYGICTLDASDLAAFPAIRPKPGACREAYVPPFGSVGIEVAVR
jgi:hypothetical protein